MYLTHNTVLNLQIKHSVVVLVYNQENSIRNALDSILNQNILPYEIIIGDDASVDNTCDIIKEYQFLYPKIIKPYFHSRNIGIFPNQNFLINQVKGDVVSFLAGDDTFQPGLFFELNKVIHNNSIQLMSDFVIVTNTMSIDKFGKKVICDNFKYRKTSAFKRRIRYSIDYRGVGISSALLKKAGKIPEDVGLNADWIWSLKIDHLSENHYYTPFISSIYYSGIGIVSKINRIDLAYSMVKVLPMVKLDFKNFLDNKDLLYLKLVENFEKYQIEPIVLNYFKFVYSTILNFNNFDTNKSFIRAVNFIPKQIFDILFLLKSKLKTF
jgi:glycosyltransferase involved in cell wall biosynthesis